MTNGAYAFSSFLVIDETQITRERLCRLLESKGHRVQAVAEANEALRVLKRADADVVLINLHNRAAGDDFARRIRDLPLGDMYTVVGLSEAGDPLSSDFDLVISRPGSYAELMEALEEMDARWTVHLPSREKIGAA
jgi:CheY-like chemotaxis protein